MENTKKGYLVFAKPKAVFFGFATEKEMLKECPTLTDAQMCLYWSKDVKGVLGLAKLGPIGDSKVTPSVPSIHIKEKIEAFCECTEEAIKQWQKEPF